MTPKIGFFTSLALLTLSGLLPELSATESSTLKVGNPSTPDKLAAEILEGYAQGRRDITIRPGTYRLPATGKTAIELNGWKDATIHANGVTLVFEELKQRPLRLQQCERVTVEGGVFRFVTPSFTQGRIKATGTDEQGTYFDWQIDAGYPIPNLSLKKIALDIVDQETRLLRVGTGDCGYGSFKTLGPGFFRLHQMNGRFAPAKVNDWIFTRGGGGSTIIHLNRCNHCVMKKVTLQNSGFAAFFETGGDGGNLYLECHVQPGPRPEGATEDQLVGCGADGFHSAGTATGPTLDRCTWEGLLHDDCIAIHGSLQKIIHATGKELILEKGTRGQFEIGQPVRISGSNGYYGEFTCTGLRNTPETLELTLDRESGAPEDSKASNPLHNGAGFKILNCTLGNCRSRGILVKADNGLIEGCTITGCGMSAISIGPEYSWNEADYSRHVVVRNNTLRNNEVNMGKSGTIFVHGDGAIGNADITIEGNRFEKNYGQKAIGMAYTDGALIENNRFISSEIPLPKGSRSAIEFKATRNVTLKKNTVTSPASDDSLIVLGKDVEGVVGNDPTGITATQIPPAKP